MIDVNGQPIDDQIKGLMKKMAARPDNPAMILARPWPASHLWGLRQRQKLERGESLDYGERK